MFLSLTAETRTPLVERAISIWLEILELGPVTAHLGAKRFEVEVKFQSK